MKKICAVVTMSFFMFSVFSNNMAYAAVAASAAENKNVKSEKIEEPAISWASGRITDGVFFSGKQIVVNIQDLHCNPDAQKSICAILSNLDEKYGFNNIYAEGAYADVNMDWICSVKDENIKNGILNSLLESGRLTGSEYYSALKNRPNIIKGAEDKDVHRQNLARLGNILEKQDYFQNQIKLMDNELKLMQFKYFNGKNRSFDKNLKDYKAGKLTPVEFYGYLLKTIKAANKGVSQYDSVYYINLSDYPNVVRFIELNYLAGKLKNKKISEQVGIFAEEIKEKVPFAVYRDMSEKTNGFSNLNDLYDYSMHIMKEYDIVLGENLNDLKACFNYISKERALDVLALITEEKRVAEKIRISLSDNINELEVAFLSDFYGYFKDYLSTAITADDYKYFADKMDTFVNTWYSYTFDSALAAMKNDFAEINKFYGVNFQRDNIFYEKLPLTANNTDAKGADVLSMPQKNIKEALQKSDLIVVVAGGFHSEGLKDLLQNKKISYITITPNVASLGNSDAVYKELVRSQAQAFAKQTIALPLGSVNAKVDFNPKTNTAAVTFSGETVNLIWNEQKQAFSFQESENIQPFEKYSGSFSEEIKFQILGAFYGLREMPLSSGNLITAIIEGLAKAGAERGYIAGNGLIWDIASNKNVQEAIKNSKEPAVLNTIAMLPDFVQKMIAGKAKEEIRIKSLKNPILEVLAETPEFKELISKATYNAPLPSKRFNPSKIIQRVTSMLMAFITVLMMVSCNKNEEDIASSSAVSEGTSSVEIYGGEQGSAEANAYIRKVSEEFLQGNPLPRSFIGSTDHIQDSYQKAIADKGIVTYDMAVLMKALLLYPEENKDIVSAVVNALDTGNNVRSNKDFTYDNGDIPLGEGYFWKILQTNSAWLQDQSQPITGENAWIANMMIGVYEAYKGTELGDTANKIFMQLSKAMLALQTDSGLVKMAPKDLVSDYSYLGIDYNQTVSIENNISVYNVFRYRAEYVDEDKKIYQNALSKLESALIGMYDASGYFDTGVNNYSAGRDINTNFATDCQTWMILALGQEKLDSLMNKKYGIENASLNLLKKTLELAGVKENGEYIGLDFSARARYVSFEWTEGFLAAAKQVLKASPDVDLQAAVDSIERYMQANENSNGLLPYVNTDEFIETGHGWIVTPGMYSLASSAWRVFDNAGGLNPFDIIVTKNGKRVFLFANEAVAIALSDSELTVETPSSRPAVTSREETPVSSQQQEEISSEEDEVIGEMLEGGFPTYYGADIWATGEFSGVKGETVTAGSTFTMGFDGQSEYNYGAGANFLFKVVMEDGNTAFFTNSESIQIELIDRGVKDPVNFARKKGQYFEGEFSIGGVIRSAIFSFGKLTTETSQGYRIQDMQINDTNDGDPRFNSLTINVKTLTDTLENYLETHPFAERIYNMYPRLATAIVSLSLGRLGAVRAESEQLTDAIISLLRGDSKKAVDFVEGHPAQTQAKVEKTITRMARAVKALVPYADSMTKNISYRLVKGSVNIMHWFSNFTAALAALGRFMSDWAVVILANSGLMYKSGKFSGYVNYNKMPGERELEPVPETTDNEGIRHTNVYFMKMPVITDFTDLQSVFKVDDDSVWVRSEQGALIIYSTADIGKVIEKFDGIISGKDKAKSAALTKKRIEKLLGALLLSAKLDNFEPGMVIDHVNKDNYGAYDENGMYVVSKNTFGTNETEIKNSLASHAEIRKVNAKAAADSEYMYIDSADMDEFKLYIAACSAAKAKNIIANSGIFAGLSEKQIIEILSLAKMNGISISVVVNMDVDSADLKNHYRELGFSNYFTADSNQGRMQWQDFFSSKTENADVYKGYKTAEELIGMMQFSKAPHKVIMVSEFERLVTGEGGTRSILDRVAVLEVFKTAVLKLKGDTLSEDFLARAGHNWDIEMLPSMPANMEKLVNGINSSNAAAVIQELNIRENSELGLYLKQIRQNAQKRDLNAPSLQTEFLKAVIEKALADKTLKENGISDGLANEAFETLLGQKLLAKLLSKDVSAEIPAEAAAFMDSARGTYAELNALITRQAQDERPMAVNATIELILLSERKAAEIRIKKVEAFNAAGITKILAAA